MPDCGTPQHTPQTSCEQSSMRHALRQYDCQHIADICEVCFTLVMSQYTDVSTLLSFYTSACCAFCGSATPAMHQIADLMLAEMTKHSMAYTHVSMVRTGLSGTPQQVLSCFYYANLLDVMPSTVQHKLQPSEWHELVDTSAQACQHMLTQ